MAGRIILPNKCSMSWPSVFPSNWETGGKAILKIDWRIQYYFYDPSHSRKKKLCIVKGMNSFKDLKTRREITKKLIESEIETNKNGYNPILKRFVVSEISEKSELHPDLPWITALEIARNKMQVTESQKNQLRWVTERMKPTAVKMKINTISIEDITRRDVRNLLDRLDLPDEYFNRFRGYLSSIFRTLVEYECCDGNIIRDIRKRKTVNRQREILSAEHFQIVMDYLKKNYYSFYRYAKIFSLSGSRTSEFFRLQAKDVDLKKQEYKITIQKGNQFREHVKVILKAALPYWEDLMKNAKPDDYIFSKNMEPGALRVNPKQVSRRWYVHVKKSKNILDKNGKPISITADFYSLKHSFLDSLDPEIAQQMAAHTNFATTAIYQVNYQKRQREILKKIEID